MSTSLPLTVSHVANVYKRYPGESVQLHTRIILLEEVASLMLTITLPTGLVLTTYRAERDGKSGSLSFDNGVRSISWHEHSGLEAGRCLDYSIAATIDADQLDWQASTQQSIATIQEYDEADTPTVRQDKLRLESKASVTYTNTDSGESEPTVTTGRQFLDETTQITVIAKGSYLQFLPALYEQDDFMGRFLMLFESFWGPLETQLAQIHHNFNPALAPTTLLSWLASWYELELDTVWSETQKRAILGKIMRLYRRRSAHHGLQEYMERFSGGTVKITEYAAASFRIGRDAQLGSGIAFGSANSPHTFAVQITAPRISDKCEGPITEEDRKARIARLTELIAAIIEAEKPAHTVCTALTIA